jgi:hypothetical protein
LQSQGEEVPSRQNLKLTCGEPLDYTVTSHFAPADVHTALFTRNPRRRNCSPGICAEFAEKFPSCPWKIRLTRSTSAAALPAC